MIFKLKLSSRTKIIQKTCLRKMSVFSIGVRDQFHLGAEVSWSKYFPQRLPQNQGFVLAPPKTWKF